MTTAIPMMMVQPCMSHLKLKEDEEEQQEKNVATVRL